MMNEENENPGGYEILSEMKSTALIMSSDHLRYDLSIRIKAQIATNYHRKLNGEEEWNYRSFPETHLGYLSKVRQQVLADIVKTSPYTVNAYDINRAGYVIWEKAKLTHPKASARMFLAVYDAESNLEHP